MKDKRRIILTLLAVATFVAALGVGFGAVSGQILTEVDYYDEDFDEYNESSVQIADDDDLQNQYLINTDEWDTHQAHNNVGIDYDIVYGDSGTYTDTHVDTERPRISWAIRTTYSDTSRTAFTRDLEVPDGMQNPVLVMEHGYYNQRSTYHQEIMAWDSDAMEGAVHSTRDYDGEPDFISHRAVSELDQGDLEKTQELPYQRHRNWQTNFFEFEENTENVTVGMAGRVTGSNRHRLQYDIRNLYWVDIGGGSAGETINGYESIPEDDSFGGPDPYQIYTLTEETAEGEQTSLRSFGSDTTKEYELEGIDEAQSVYFTMEASSNTEEPVDYTINVFGQEVAGGSIDPGTTSETVEELDIEDDEIELVIESEGQYDIHHVGFSTLEETTAGDPLSQMEQPVGITLDPDDGYDQVIDMFISALDLSTNMLLLIVMIALIVGFMVFTYTKSLRGQELAQSLLFGAMIAGVVLLGLVPTMNMATWVFTGDTERAPLADPALEAEPPTYYSTEFQAGTMDGWEYDNARATGTARPVSIGDEFDVEFSGSTDNSGVITHHEHISLGHALDTGFVEVSGSAQGTAGYDSPAHEVTYNIRVYVTDDGNLPESEKLDTSHGQNYIEDGYEGAEGAAELRDEGESDHIYYVGEVARSFDGEVQVSSEMATFALDGEHVHTELVVTDNRADEDSVATLSDVRVGATTEGGSVEH